MKKRGKLSYSDRPESLRHSEVKGVFVGGCIERGVGSRFRAKAHAHTGGSHRGWICFLSDKWLGCSELCLHELAHVVTREGHTRRWREYLLSIGGTIDEIPGVIKSYHPQTRAKVIERDVRPDGTVFVTYDNGSVTCYLAKVPASLARSGNPVS